jgi:hypothetical protein
MKARSNSGAAAAAPAKDCDVRQLSQSVNTAVVKDHNQSAAVMQVDSGGCDLSGEVPLVHCCYGNELSKLKSACPAPLVIESCIAEYLDA